MTMAKVVSAYRDQTMIALDRALEADLAGDAHYVVPNIIPAFLRDLADESEELDSTGWFAAVLRDLAHLSEASHD